MFFTAKTQRKTGEKDHELHGFFSKDPSNHGEHGDGESPLTGQN